MILTEVSAPPSAAVPVRAFAEHLRLGSGFADDGSQDAVLELYLRSAMAAIEARLGRALLARGLLLDGDRWREDASQGLPIAPVRSVEAVTLVEADGGETVVEPGGLVGDARQPAAAAGRQVRPQPAADPARRATRRSASPPGFGEGWEDVPADLRQAVFLLAAHFYENRAEGAASAGIDAVRGAGADRGLPRDADRRRAVMSDGVRLLRRLVLETRGAPAGRGGRLRRWPGGRSGRSGRTCGRAAAARSSSPGSRGRGSSTASWCGRRRSGAPSRPRADQRLREGARVFDILTVAEHDAGGRYLEIVAEEGVLP